MKPGELREYASSEGLKSLAEMGLGVMGPREVGRKLLEWASGGEVIDGRLKTSLAGIDLKSPLIVGAGWDKKGRAVEGLLALGFAAVEVGSVLPFYQFGQKRPRMWSLTSLDGVSHSVGLNALGFNAQGMEHVSKTLEPLQSRIESGEIIVGINIGQNKLVKSLDGTYSAHAWAHALVADYMYPFASYFVVNPSSPNTENLRLLQAKNALREIIVATKGVISQKELEGHGRKSLWVKLAPDLAPEELDAAIEVVVEEKAAGVIMGNTTNNQEILAKYGREGARGGLSGNDPDYQHLTTSRIRYIYEQAGDRIAVIGCGGVNSGKCALEKIEAGASALQVVTAIRQHKAKVAHRINTELIELMGMKNYSTMKHAIGAATVRGSQATA